MTRRHLVIVALGPVQDFIAQARRTRDLWYGSELLSELSRFVATTLADAPSVTLIFPSDPATPNVPNKIVARVEGRTDDEVDTLVASARDDAMSEWKRIADETKELCAGLIVRGARGDALWDEQIATFLEFNAAMGDEAALGGYESAREQIERALAARKGLREFAPWTEQMPGHPKSSLDGARQSVLLPGKGKERDPSLVRKYRIDPREQLDAVGLVKRTRLQKQAFLPVTNVALAPWIDEAAKRVPAVIDTLRSLCSEHDLNPVSSKVTFPWEAQVFMAERWQPIAKEHYRDDGDEARRHALIDALRGAGRKLFRRGGMREPYPYVACLVADGDHMGDAIRSLGDAELHRRFSARLSHFAARAKGIVQGDFGGSLVYSGGDDVLAFVSVHRALPCADSLRRCFEAVMEDALRETPQVARPTLSVGIGVGHVLESMGHLLWLGREAEKLAKGAALPVAEDRRKALALIVDKRSGGATSFRAQWAHDPVARLGLDATLIGETLPVGKVHEVRALLSRMPDPKELKAPRNAESEGDVLRVLALDTRRILSRVESGDGALTPEAVGLDLTGERYEALHASISAWIARMLVARAFSEAARSLSPVGGSRS